MSEMTEEQSGEDVKPTEDQPSADSKPVAVATQSASATAVASIPTVQVSSPAVATTSDPAVDSMTLRITQIEEEMGRLKVEREQLTAQQQQNPAEFTEERYRQSAQLLDEIQKLEREKHELEFQASRQRGSTPKLPTMATPQSQSVLLIKMCLRKRTEQNQLKDIKFDFVPGKDSADAISNDLIAAGLLEMKNVVVVAANIMKLVENPSQKKLVFPLGNVPSSQVDEKKLVGYAQLNIME
jgi:serine/threonine-protein kinase OSR1/STK39